MRFDYLIIAISDNGLHLTFLYIFNCINEYKIFLIFIIEPLRTISYIVYILKRNTASLSTFIELF